VKKLVAVFMIGAWFILHGATAGAQTTSPQENSSPTIKSQDLDLLRKDLRAMRKQLIAQNLKLTEAEATKVLASLRPVHYRANCDQRQEVRSDSRLCRQLGKND
jgi:hypothetical protein